MRIVGVDQVADLFGVAPKTIHAWDEEGFPVAQRGRPGTPSEFESSEVIAWAIQRAVFKASGERPRDRLHRAQSEAQELKNAVLRGEFAPIGDLERAIATVARRVAGILEGIVPGIKRRMPDADDALLELVDAEIVRARNEAATMDLSAADARDPDDE